MKPKTKKVIIVVPVYKANLTENEKISLRHLILYLSKYDKCLVMPDNINFKLDGFAIKKFPNRYFLTKRAYNSLLVSKEFYLTFQNYEYMLIYQLDCLVFSDALIKWCDAGYDYIGAPWINSKPEKDDNIKLTLGDVGNGGFSLRNVKKCIQVLSVYKSRIRIWRNRINIFLAILLSIRRKFAAKAYSCMSGKEKLSQTIKTTIASLKQTANDTNFEYVRQEDKFWSYDACKVCPDFKIASPEIALSFSFEAYPSFCFEINKRKLPFGCHAWTKNDGKFWKQFLNDPASQQL